jgi:hypothetical protein
MSRYYSLPSSAFPDLYRYHDPNLISATPAAIMTREVARKDGLTKDLRGLGAEEVNMHFRS